MNTYMMPKGIKNGPIKASGKVKPSKKCSRKLRKIEGRISKTILAYPASLWGQPVISSLSKGRLSVWGLTLRMVAEALMGTFTEDLYVPIFKGRVESTKDISVFI